MTEAVDSRRLDAVVFDLDGVIVDTEHTLFQAWSSVFVEYGCVVERSEWQTLIGTSGTVNPYDWLIDRGSGPVPLLDDITRVVRAREKVLVDALEPMAGVREWVVAAGELGMARAVASSSAESWVHARLEQVGLFELFDVVVCAGGGLEPKPAPDVYLRACATLGVAPSRAVAIEDSARGVAAATAAGMRCVAVPNAMTFDMDFSGAHHHVSSLADLALEDALRLAQWWD